MNLPQATANAKPPATPVEPFVELPARDDRPTPTHAEVVTAWLNVLVESGTVVELRAVQYCERADGRFAETVAGFFDSDHLAAMATRALAITGKAEGTYWTLNPLRPEMLARCANRARPVKKKDVATADEHVLRRRWLLVDADPVRVKGISASDAEKAAARTTIIKVRDSLAGRGWSAPILADSGNGFHLLYRVDLPADDGGLIKRVLEALAAEFDDEHVTIDPINHNPSRICKLYGSVSRKGDSVADRPHRRARILEIPGCPDPLRPDTPELVPVPRELLEALAAQAPPPEPTQVTPSPKPAASGRVAKWLDKAYKAAYGSVATAGVGQRHPTLMKQATTLAGYLHYGAACPYTEAELEDSLTAAADLAAPERACDNRRCTRDAIRYGKANRLHLPDELHRLTEPSANGTGHREPPAGDSGRGGDDAHGDAYEPPPDVAPPQTGFRFAPVTPAVIPFMNSAEFDAKTYSREWYVKQVLVADQPCIVGAPKKGMKTTVAIDQVLSLGTGTAFLGEFQVPRAVRAALLCGESGEATIQETARRIATAKGIKLADADVCWGFRLPQLARLDHVLALQKALRTAGIKVLVLDPLYLSLLSGAGGEGPQASNLYEMGPHLLAVARACLDVGCTPILVHHFKLTRADHQAEPELEDLAFAGVQEFARQWVLIGRREKYVAGSGEHRLWLKVGGSAGHSSCWAVDANEGVVDENFAGRFWDVKVLPPGEARQTEQARRADLAHDKKEQVQRADEAAVLAILDRMDPGHSGYGQNQIVTALTGQVSRQRVEAALSRLALEGDLCRCQVEVVVGHGARQKVNGFRRVG